MAEVDTAARLRIPAYTEDVERVASLPIDWSAFEGATVAISGATGMVGAFLIDALMARNAHEGMGCHVVAIGRSKQKAGARLPWFDDPLFSFVEGDVGSRGFDLGCRFDMVVHLASATHPRAYATDPIGTMAANLTGLENLLWAVAPREGGLPSFVFASSVEVYGQNRGDVERFSEDYLGYIDCCTVRAGYPEAKRAGEAMCLAHAAQRGLVVKVPRLPRTFGPTLLPTDTKASSQFIGNGVRGEDIVLKSEGTQLYSYLHVADTVAGMLYVIANGEPQTAYNLADPSCDVTLRGMAEAIAGHAGTRVVFDLPDATERAGFSTATKAIMDGSRVRALSWEPRYGIEEALAQTVDVLKKLS